MNDLILETGLGKAFPSGSTQFEEETLTEILAQPRGNIARIIILGWVLISLPSAPVHSDKDPAIDLSRAAIVLSESSSILAKAAEMLQEEIFTRTNVRLIIVHEMPGSQGPVILLGTIDSFGEEVSWLPDGETVPRKPESYGIWVDAADHKAPAVCLLGSDERGVLFAVGRLLRLLAMREGELTLPGKTRVFTSPRYPVRGHELGYRHLSNTYDAWDLERYEQYVRDQIVFGANTVSLIPSLDRELMDSPHMRTPVWKMTVELARMIDSYGLDVWLYLPLLDDIHDSAAARETLEDRRVLFQEGFPLDAVFVPGGDPGDTPPELLLPWLKDLAGVLRESHPQAQLWLSNEDFEASWNDDLFEYLQEESPGWLTGIIFGTWTKLSLPEQRKRVPERYPIVQYPDITHCIQCQYPVPNWDRAFARTLGREPINPRPRDYSQICRLLLPHSQGFVTYSDGVNDDVNKFLWTALGWDPEVNVDSILREYGRYFVGEEYGDAMAEGLIALEGNWQGPICENRQVEGTLSHWRSLETRIRSASSECLHDPFNWRFQMGLFRAYYDAYIQQKAILERDLERRALGELQRAPEIGVEAAIRKARSALSIVDSQPPAPELRGRIEELGHSLFEEIGMQLSVDRYGAFNWERGAVLDFLDEPLNNRVWIESEISKALAEEDETLRSERIDRVVRWEDPGSGGFYDDLGNASKQAHLAGRENWAGDPGFVEYPQDEFIETRPMKPWRLSWMDQGQTLYGTPLKMRYENLDPEARYRLRVVYTGRFKPTLFLLADGRYEIHGPLSQPEEPVPLEFDVPEEATKDGILDLEWNLVKGRGVQVAEVWLLWFKEKSSEE